jgi:hypothetical protein
MEQWRETYEWMRAILAVIGAMACALVLLVAIFLWQSDPQAREMGAVEMQQRKADPLLAAADLLAEAGIDRSKQKLELFSSYPGEGRYGDLQLWVVRAPRFRARPAPWVSTQEIPPEFALAAKATLDAAHRADDFFPDWDRATRRRMRIQPIQFVFTQRHLGYARLALYDPASGMLYLVINSTPTDPPSELPAQALPAPSTG